MAAPKGNKYAVGNSGGRPLKFKSVEELQAKIDAYYESCYQNLIVRDNKGNIVMDENDKPVFDRVCVEPICITGLALALDCDRDTLLNYENKEEFFGTIRRAKLYCQSFAEKHLFTAKNPAGAIFNLKNNYGWKDVTQTDVNNISNYADRLAQAEAKNQNNIIDVTPKPLEIEG